MKTVKGLMVAAKILLVAAIFTFGLSSCYTATHIVGNGAQGSQEVTGKNTYFIYGLVDGNQADTKSMAGGATDYTIVVEHSFIDGLLSGITWGIYNPVTVKVIK